MAIDRLVDQLARDLQPVRRRSAVADALVLAGVCVSELALFFGLHLTRPDMDVAVQQPSFWWRLVCLGVIAGIGAAVALASFHPAGRRAAGCAGWARSRQPACSPAG